jgi:hypothetical protein
MEDIQVKKSFLTLTLCFAILAFAGAAMAADDGVTLSKDGRQTISTRPPGHSQPYVEDNTGLTTIINNLGTAYPDGVYWCCTGSTIFGPANTLESPPVTFWSAVAFTPKTSLSVTKISVAVGFVNYGEKYTDILVTLANDNNGVPGTAIKTWKVSSLPTFGDCCTVDTAQDSTGLPVTAGTQYWVSVTTEKKSDIWAAWNLNDTKQLSTNAVKEASYCHSTGTTCGSDNGKWVAFDGYPGLAIGVWGK